MIILDFANNIYLIQEIVMPIAEGTNKVLAYGPEASWSTLAPTNSGIRLRRVTGTFSLVKETYQSEEIRDDYQIVDYRHGVRSVDGSLSGELSPGSYEDFFAAVLAKDFVTGATTGALITLSIDATTRTISRTAGSFLTDGFKVGEVVRCTGWVAAANNNRNLLIASIANDGLSFTFFVIDGGTLVTEAAGASVTITMVGKKTYTPLTGHTDKSFTFEEWFPSASISEVYSGCKVGSVSLSLPSSGLTTVDFSFMGRDLAVRGSSQYFLNPAAASTSGIFAAVNGALLVDGVPVALVTSADFNVERNMSTESVVGSNLLADITENRVIASGNLEVLYSDATFLDAFDNETELALSIILTTDNSFDSDFVGFTFPRIKVGSFEKSDGEEAIKASVSFQALRGLTEGSSHATTLVVQDSLA